jgi:cell division protein FtsX
VGTSLRNEPCVRQVAFISKAQAFAMLKKEHPKLLGAMPPGIGNPLPDSYDVTPDKPSCAAAIAAAARAAHWPGVQQVALKRRPATRAGS